MADRPTETRKKICLLGSFAVGKSSLVGRYVHRVFSDRYLTTVGVRIDKKSIAMGSHHLTLLLWDIHGEDAVQIVRDSYVRGAAGCLLVADGTRPDTLSAALEIKGRVERVTGKIPFVLLVNKRDLADEWRVPDTELATLRAGGLPVALTSAKTGEGVEEAFAALAAALCPKAE